MSNNDTDGVSVRHSKCSLSRIIEFMFVAAINLAIVQYMSSSFARKDELREIAATMISLETTQKEYERKLRHHAKTLHEAVDQLTKETETEQIYKNEQKSLRLPILIESFSQKLEEIPVLYSSMSSGKLKGENLMDRKEKNIEQVLGVSRKLQSEEDLPACDGSVFRLDLHLDGDSHQTSWSLKNNINSNLIAHDSYAEPDNRKNRSFQTCLPEGSFTLTLMDDVYGINCNFENQCYEIYLDNKLLVNGFWFSREVRHSFDTSMDCPIGFHFQLNVLDDLNIPHVNWSLFNKVTNSPITLQPISVGHSTHMNSYYTCVQVGAYDFTVLERRGRNNDCWDKRNCYQIFINDHQSFEEHDFLQESTFSFYVSNTGKIDFIKEAQCNQLPILAPTNELNNYTFDEVIERKLQVISSLSSEEQLNDFSSAQYKAACWVLFDDPLNEVSDDRLRIERYAFAVLLYSLNQDHMLMIPSETCDFDKITCDYDGHIRQVNIPHLRSGGTIPKELSHLQKLETFAFGWIDIEGTIPSEIGRLENLKYIFAQNNHISGLIPSEIGRLSKLEGIDLKSNKLGGSIPSEIGLCTHLQRFDITANNVIGTLPTELFVLINITHLMLFSNSLTGTIPTLIGQLEKLVTIRVSSNNLLGTLPSELGLLPSLKTLNLYDNMFHGTIPREFGNLMTLESLHLSSNSLTGSLPEFGAFPFLWNFDVSNNELTGIIPDSFFDIDMASNVGATKAFAKIALHNHLRANITDEHCDKANINFLGINFPTLFLDDSDWFLDEPKINCSCCAKGHCYLWSDTRSLIHGTPRPKCPASNIHSIRTQYIYGGFDIIKGEIHIETAASLSSSGNDVFVTNDMCLSPSGCYLMFKDTGVVSTEVDLYSIGYSNFSNGLVTQSVCDAVEICGISIGADHPRRVGLNHLTQLVIPDLNLLQDPTSPHYKAVCWMITEDEKFEEFEVCDGTLLQRYVILYMYYLYNIKFINFEELATSHTCEWTGVICDSRNRFIIHLDFSNKDLKGTFATEIGLLNRLSTINLSDNDLTGTLDSSTFSILPYLERFSAQNNSFGGEIPNELMSLENIRKINLSKNLLVGGLPDDVEYSERLEALNVSDNLLQGEIVSNLVACRRLEQLDLAKNNFFGRIPDELGYLSNLKQIRLNQNRLVGSIPLSLIKLSNIRTLQLQSNLLTGSIPTTIGLLQSAQIISLSHNFLKGEIPSELANMANLMAMHLHSNQLTGTAPDILFQTSSKNTYITDCGVPSFALPKPLVCTSCTMCCNSDQRCVVNSFALGFEWATISTPLIISALLWIVLRLKKSGMFSHFFQERKSLSIIELDSVYFFLFSSNVVAWGIYIVTIVIQILLFVIYLNASRVTDGNTDVNFSFRCPKNDTHCTDTKTASQIGWVAVTLVIALYLGSDLTMSILQIQKGFISGDKKIFLSGFLLLSLTILAIFTSLSYNKALAEKNTDLVMNAVVLLFINDLDEQFYSCLEQVAPEWLQHRFEEVQMNLSEPEGDKAEKSSAQYDDDMGNGMNLNSNI